MECMCAWTRPRFILSSERVLGEWCQNPCELQGKINSTGKILPRGGSNPRRCIKQDSEPNTLPTSYSCSPVPSKNNLLVCWLSLQHAFVSQGRICSDKLTCCHADIEVADQAFCLTKSQETDTRLTSPSADPITPGAWQGNHWSSNL